MKKKHWYNLWALYGFSMMLWTYGLWDKMELYAFLMFNFILIALVMTLPHQEDL